MNQATTLTVIIASPEHLPALQARATAAAPQHAVPEFLTFADADALRALETITKRKPAVVALERLFAATPRGAALINRVKADPSLRASEIRVVAHDSDYMRVSPRMSPPGAPGPAPLDQRGTRRAPRVRISPRADATVDGHQASLIDLSTVGAQVVSPGMLKPNQRVQVVLADDSGLVRFSGDVAWAFYEIPPKGGPRYRAGIAFIDADAAAVDAYGLRHKA